VPPLLGAGVRFLTAAAILLSAIAALGGRQRLRGRSRETVAAGAVGTLILVGGIGLVTLAEQHVPSGLAALLIASVPLWVVLLRLVFREHVAPTMLVGVAGGFAGVALPVLPSDGAGGASLGWLAVLLAAALFTALGALASDRWTLPANTTLSTAIEMSCAGALLLVLALIVGEAAELDVAQLSRQSLLALAYLVLVGSIVAYSAFVWLLQHASPSTVATYAYVNPAVALILGWLILSEEITATMFVGALVIFASVALVVRRD
jgi:drug/metabolite transporter (DMT)-like permease